ncbi:hypothetical protein ABZ359_34380 [Streptomyces sp. NPDC005968]|uniref:hypothetical protein n=1 Tax=Streptomyces sp. NPDC005968 TaxID=3154574 RepID=UPI0033C3498D
MGSDVPSADRVPRQHATPTNSTFKKLEILAAVEAAFHDVAALDCAPAGLV